MRFKRKSLKLAAAVGVAPAIFFGSASLAGANLTNGQYVSNSGHQCWGQDYITGGYDAGPVHLQEHSYIYRNCRDYAVHRKADIIADWDGSCYNVSARRSRVLAVKYTVPRDVYRNAKSC